MDAERKEREAEHERQEQAARAAGEHVAGRRGVLFSETLKTLSRLTSSYRRCHWKTAAELIFPLLYQHVTFASHRTWNMEVACQESDFLLCRSLAAAIWLQRLAAEECPGRRCRSYRVSQRWPRLSPFSRMAEGFAR